ncbi:MAG: DUF1906 domain-containing protein [Actinomyces sp.]|nr:DUF1906 domain-containing protein [Actinomyces sp.]
MTTVLDFSASFPKAADIHAARHAGAVCYVSPARETWMKAKPITKAVADSYRAAGLKIGAVWQYGGASNPDAMRGAAGGRADALAADAALTKAGLAGHPVYFAVDFDIPLGQWNSTAVHYFRAAGAVLGRQRVGIYGHSRAVAWAQEDGVVADLGGGRCLGWVTRSWSRGETGADYAALYQGTHNVPGPSGVQVDVNTVYAPQWGQAPITKHKETAPVDVSALPRVDQTLWLNRHYTPGRVFNGVVRKVKYIVRHHNAGMLTTQGCWDVWQNREASAHYQVSSPAVSDSSSATSTLPGTLQTASATRRASPSSTPSPVAPLPSGPSPTPLSRPVADSPPNSASCTASGALSSARTSATTRSPDPPPAPTTSQRAGSTTRPG